MTDSNTIYVTTDGTNSTQKLINAAIKNAYTNKKTKVHLNAGVFIISNPIEMYSGIELEGAGKDKTIIKLMNKAYLNTGSKFYIKPAYYKTYSDMVALIWPIGSTAKIVASANNVTFHDFSVDGNFSGNSAISRGRGYYNIIYFNKSKNIEVYNVHFHDSHGDGFRGTYVDTVNIHDSKLECLGHDATFFLRSNNCHNYNNIVKIQTNSAGRFNDCTNSSAHDNDISAYDSNKSDAGNGGYQIERQYKDTITVDIYNNKIHDTLGTGIWIVRNSAAIAESGKSKVQIYNNKFYNCGCSSNIPYVAGVVEYGIHNLYIYNNVFDNCYNAGITAMGMQDSVKCPVSTSVYVYNNIITNTQKRKYSPAGTGYGIMNRLSNCKLKVWNNDVYGSVTGNYLNVTPTNDINKDPLYVDKANRNYNVKANSPCIGAGTNKGNIGLISSTATVASNATTTVSTTTESTSTAVVSENTTTVAEDTTNVVTEGTTNVVEAINLASITLHPKYSFRLKESNPTSVLSSNTYFDIGALGINRYRGIIYFDLSSIKTGAKINNATLSLYWYHPASAKRSNNTVIKVFRPMSYQNDGVSWKNRTKDTTWQSIGGNWYDSKKIVNGNNAFAAITLDKNTVPTFKYQTFDVTNLVQAYVNGTYTNTGFFLKDDVENNSYVAFYNGNYSDSNKKMKLTVIYEE